MRSNERIIKVFEIKRPIDLAKVRLCTTHPVTGERTTRVAYVSKSDIPTEHKVAYYVQIQKDVLNPFEGDADGIAGLSHGRS